MPLISQIGHRSFAVRMLILGMYLLLSTGAIVMAYPFLLMLAMSTTGRPDFQEFRLVPRFWKSDAALYKKYLLDHVPYDHPSWLPNADVPVYAVAHWFGQDKWFLPMDVREEDFAGIRRLPEASRRAMAADVREFITRACPPEFKIPCGLFDEDSVFSLRIDYFAWLKQRYGSLDEVNRRYPDTAAAWAELGVVVEQRHRHPGDTLREREWREFLETRPPEQTGLFDPNGWVFGFYRGRTVPESYPGARDAKGNIILSQITYDELHNGKLGQDDKDKFFRTTAPARYVQVDTHQALAAWQAFLAKKKADPATPLEARIPAETALSGLWSQFVQSECPIDALRLARPEDTFRPFLQKKYGAIDALNRAYGTSYTGFEEVQIPFAAFSYDNFLKEKPGLRWKYIAHNFKTVFAFITVHGRALRVTLIYIILMVTGALTINPLAAYAMSRFRLQESHHVLIFLLATMAFPAEVLMIPEFLLIKNFPLLQVVVIIGCLLGFYALARRLGKRLPLLLSVTLALVVTAFIAGWALPRLAGHFNVKISVSLMNTFFALVLPGLANGYGIFLLKGFFDSLPPELYEAGLIDGASELRMFWQITLPLCKPILAVMALGAFSVAYGAFMHAFLICQDPKMWTFMVFLYEFQQLHTVPLVMAALVVAALPTLTIFIFCQNIILRGIVIPSFK